MCGISCVINSGMLDVDVRNYMKQALLVNTLRGDDSTGIASVNNKGEFIYFKKPYAGPDFLQLSAAEAVLSFDSPRFVFGHNRATTRGSSHNVNHAHPVSYDHILLIQNGTLTTTYELVGTGGTYHDTSAIAEAMAKMGEKETLEKLNGSYALIWYNSKTQTLNLARNQERPLWIGYLKSGKGWLIGSEDGMVDWLAVRNRIEIKSIAQLKEGLWVRIPLDRTKQVTREKFKIYKAVSHNHHSDDRPYHGGGRYPVPFCALTKTGDVFKAAFEGTTEIVATKEKYLRFKRVGDTTWAWKVNYDDNNPLMKLLLVDGTYTLKALGDRSSARSTHNVDAMLMGKDVPVCQTKTNPQHPLYYYNKGERINFRVVEDKEWHLEGITDDTNDMEIRIFNLPEEVKLDTEKVYSGEIQNVVINRGGDDFIILDPKSISAPTSSEFDGQCSWCPKPLTKTEIENNQCPEIGGNGILCDVCKAQYTFSTQH